LFLPQMSNPWMLFMFQMSTISIHQLIKAVRKSNLMMRAANIPNEEMPCYALSTIVCRSRLHGSPGGRFDDFAIWIGGRGKWGFWDESLKARTWSELRSHWIGLLVQVCRRSRTG
jgi:hypothetical protein